jgi:BirA family biotin operon repressor/biotin-[acetyl-CoA-carboxylase] ligase
MDTSNRPDATGSAALTTALGTAAAAAAAATAKAAGTADPARIDRARLESLLGDGAHGWSIEIVEQTGSTNADLTDRLRESRALPAPVVRVAYLQNAGRGRRGRPWLAAPGHALLFSLAYPLQRPLDGLAGLSLAVGTAVTAGLRALPLDAADRLALKWPNDILLDGAKLGGVLIETAWSTAEMSAVVIGIGLNLRDVNALTAELAALSAAAGDASGGRGNSADASTDPSNGPSAPPTAAATLEQAWPQPDITETLAQLLNALAHTLARFGQAGFAPFRELWLADHAYAGRQVALIENGVTIARGTAESVDTLGQLLIATPQGMHTCVAGDVSLRLRNGAHANSTDGP